MSQQAACTKGRPLMDRATGHLLDAQWIALPLRLPAQLIITPLGALSVTLLVPLILLHS